MVNRLEKSQLFSEIQKILIREQLVSSDDVIEFQSICTKQQRGMDIQHYIISVSNRKFFIRMTKENDNSFHVMPFLKKLDENFKNTVPIALTKPFTIAENTFIITSYIEGVTLEHELSNLTNSQLKNVSYKIDEKLQRMHDIKHSYYSLGNTFCDQPFNKIMYEKMKKQLYENQSIYLGFKIEPQKLLCRAKSILNKSFFSEPTLVHMDIKPGNIILSSKDLVLIDYELSRFADIDYEWSNLLIKTLLDYDKRFIQYVLKPIIENNFMSLERAITNEKICVYLLYLSLNMYIYYFKSNRSCPEEITYIVNTLLKQLI